MLRTGALFALAAAVTIGAAQPKNVLMIAIDDLKPTIGAFGDPYAVTPNMDRLGAMGTVFLNAHCQQAVCAPSRASLLTGHRPDRTRVWDLQTKMREMVPETLTLPEHFRVQGYTTIGMGKIFDFRSVDGWNTQDDASWDEFHHPSHAANATGGFLSPDIVSAIRQGMPEQNELGRQGLQAVEAMGQKWTHEGPDVPDTDYADGALGAFGVETLARLAEEDEPFFLAVGFQKPHLPFNAPAKYWDLYDADELPKAANPEHAEGAPAFHFQPSWELRSYAGVPPQPEPIPDDLAREMVHGYYACASFVDAQIGKLLDALEEYDLTEDTVIVLWGDHGFHLGDHGMWCKHTNYEQATRVPLIVVDPGQTPGVSEAPVEFVDVFPTMVDLAGVAPVADLDGVSLRPALQDPSVEVKEVAISQYPRGFDNQQLMGYAMRDGRFRYIEWRVRDENGIGTGEVVAVELYDYAVDPLETKNMAEVAAYAGVIERFEALAEKHLP